MQWWRFWGMTWRGYSLEWECICHTVWGEMLQVEIGGKSLYENIYVYESCLKEHIPSLYRPTESFIFVILRTFHNFIVSQN